jgi:hypothetical protein
MSLESYSKTPPSYGRIPRARGWISLNGDEPPSPFTTHGSGTLTNLIKSRSHTSLANLRRRSSSFRGERETPDGEDEEDTGTFERARRGSRDIEEGDDFRRNEERRMSIILNTPHMRSQRLIGNSNPRYKWGTSGNTQQYLRILDSLGECQADIF